MPALFTILAFLIPVLQGALCHVGARYECPKVDPSPCSCLDTGGKVFLRCSKLSSGKQLAAAVRGMAGYGIHQLEVWGSNVSYIPYDLFRGSPVTRVIVRHSSMFYLFDRELDSNADHVTEIELDHVHFGGGLDWSVLENLRHLRTVVVYETNVESIPYGFSELELPLETLTLQNNYIETVYETAFQNLKQLKNLQLSRNYLKQYQRSMLPLPTSGIQFLDLGFNKLSSLPADAFDGMPDLHSLLLRGNHFTLLDRTYMDRIFSSLTFLDVAKNPLVCNCDMAWVLSDPKPLNLMGDCRSTQDTAVKRNLKDLTKNDFAECV